MRIEDEVRIRHMIDAAELAGQFMAGKSRADLDNDRMLLFALVRALEVIGEAAARVSETTRIDAPYIPWLAIVGMRNRLIHGYFDINTEIVWKTVNTEIPVLLAGLRALIKNP